MLILACDCCSFLRQIFEESSKLQNIRLERQQALQKKHLRELKEFAEAYSNDKLPSSSSSSSQRERQNSEHGSISSEQSHCSSQTSIGKVSLWCRLVLYQQQHTHALPLSVYYPNDYCIVVSETISFYKIMRNIRLQVWLIFTAWFSNFQCGYIIYYRQVNHCIVLFFLLITCSHTKRSKSYLQISTLKWTCYVLVFA